MRLAAAQSECVCEGGGKGKGGLTGLLMRVLIDGGAEEGLKMQKDTPR
jgi:hypothetical protein